MQHLIKTLVPVAAIIFLAACGGNNAGKQENHDHEQVNTAAPVTAAVQLKDDKLNAVYQHYVHLTTALAKGDMSEAKMAGNAIETGLTQVAGGNAAGAAAAKITGAKDITAQRSAYAALSNEFITLVKRSGLNSGELYVDFCPMAENDKGAYWLSAEKDIKNPYMGEAMLTCGEIRDSIR